MTYSHSGPEGGERLWKSAALAGCKQTVNRVAQTAANFPAHVHLYDGELFEIGIPSNNCIRSSLTIKPGQKRLPLLFTTKLAGKQLAKTCMV